MAKRLLSALVFTAVATASFVACLQVSAATPSSTQAKGKGQAAAPAPLPCDTDDTSKDTGAPMDPEPDSRPEYLIGPTDNISIVVNPDYPTGEAQRCTNETYIVGTDGKINFCQIGSVVVEGMTARALEDKLSKAIVDAGIWRTSSVTVLVKDFRSQSVIVAGAVRTPGEVKLKGDEMTLLTAVATAGGFSQEAGPIVWVLRPLGTVTNVIALTKEDPKIEKRKYLRTAFDSGMSNPRLRNGDNVFVEKGEVFFVNGEVKSGGQKTWACGMNVGKAIALSSGETEKASISRSHIKRFNAATKKYETIKGLKLETDILANDELNIGKKLF